MGSIAATKPDMGVLSQKRLILSPFSALVLAFSEDLLARNGFEEGLWPFIPLELLEEGETAPPPRPVPPTVQMDLKLVLQTLRQTGGHTRQEQITQRIVERIIRLREGKGPRPNRSRSAARQPPAGSGQAETAQSAPVKGQRMAGEVLARTRTILHQISVLRQNFYNTVNQHTHFTANLTQTVPAAQPGRQTAPEEPNRRSTKLSHPFQAREHAFPELSASVENRAGGISAAALPAPAAPRAGTISAPAMSAAFIPELPGRGRKETGGRFPDRRETQRRTLEELSYSASGEGTAGTKESGTDLTFMPRSEAARVAGRLAREFTAPADGRNARGQTPPSRGFGQEHTERRETRGPAGDVSRQTPARQEGPARGPRPEARPGWEQVSDPETVAPGGPDGPDTDHPSWRRRLQSSQEFGGMSPEEKLTIPSAQDIRITGGGQTGPERGETHAVTSDIAAAIPSMDRAELTYRTAPGGSEQPGTTPGIADTSSQSAAQTRAGVQNNPGTGKKTGVPESRSETGGRTARVRTADRADGKTSGSSMPREALRLPAAPGENAAGGGPVGQSADGVSVEDTQNRRPEGRDPLALRRDASGAQWDGRHKEGARAPGLTPAADGAERRIFAAVRDIRLFRTEPRAGTAQGLQATGNMVGGLSGEEIVCLTRDPAGDMAAGRPGQSAVRAAGTAQEVRPQKAARTAQQAQTAGTEYAARPPRTTAQMTRTARMVSTAHTVGPAQSRSDLSGTIFSRPAQAGARDTLTRFRERPEGRAAHPALPAGGAMAGQAYGQPKGFFPDLRGAAAFGGSERVPLDLLGTVSGGQPDEASLGAVSAGQVERAPLSPAGMGPVTLSPGLADGPEAMPELAYAGRGRNAERDMGARPQEQQSRQGRTGSDGTPVLPDWARRFLLEGGPQGRTGASGKTDSAKIAAALPAAAPQAVISWTAPDYRPASSIAFKERREPQPQPQNIRISDAEIRRTAEKVYRIIEERIRRERRRLGL